MTEHQIDPRANSQSGPHARDHRMSHDQLSEEYTIDTPENVSFGYEVAGIGSRFIAALVDHLILGLLLVGLNIAIVVLISSLAGDSSSIEQSLEETPEDWVAGLLIALYALLNFAIWWGYYLLFEWLWHGQTVGKRMAHIRVVRLDGAPVSFVPLAVRNLVRIVDFLPVGYGVGVVTMFCNRHARRLGDFAAGTLVVKDQGELTLNSLLSSSPAPARTTTSLVPPPVSTPELMPEIAPEITPEITPDQDWSGIRRLTPADYELVQETLARYRAGALERALLARVATAIATKLDRAPSSQLDQPTVADPVNFLMAVATAYGRWVR
jgi:uncharacterized RDD family membrane protein YckC